MINNVHRSIDNFLRNSLPARSAVLVGGGTILGIAILTCAWHVIDHLYTAVQNQHLTGRISAQNERNSIKKISNDLTELKEQLFSFMSGYGRGLPEDTTGRFKKLMHEIAQGALSAGSHKAGIFSLSFCKEGNNQKDPWQILKDEATSLASIHRILSEMDECHAYRAYGLLWSWREQSSRPNYQFRLQLLPEIGDSDQEKSAQKLLQLLPELERQIRSLSSTLSIEINDIDFPSNVYPLSIEELQGLMNPNQAIDAQEWGDRLPLTSKLVGLYAEMEASNSADWSSLQRLSAWPNPLDLLATKCLFKKPGIQLTEECLHHLALYRNSKEPGQAWPKRNFFAILPINQDLERKVFKRFSDLVNAQAATTQEEISNNLISGKKILESLDEFYGWIIEVENFFIFQKNSTVGFL